MSINLQRSKRATDFWRIPTPNNVGPGLYNSTNRIQSLNTRENVAPFNSMKERANEYYDDNPGPGTYASNKVKVVSKVEDK